ncbi:MAG: hypothetical protein ACHQ1H_08870, partial [Nitrososphaerales archaeon]
TNCEAANRALGAFSPPRDGERYEAYIGSPIFKDNACCTHTILLSSGPPDFPCPQTGCHPAPYGMLTTVGPDEMGNAYAIQSDAWNGQADGGYPNANAGVDIIGPQAINAWLHGGPDLSTGTNFAKNLVARWDGVGVGQSGGGYSTWQLGQVMFVMRVYGFDVSTSPITLNNGIVTTYSAVFTSMESELWSLLSNGGYLPNTYNANGGLGGHDPENMDAGLLPFSSSVVHMVQIAQGCVGNPLNPCPN